MHNSLRPDRIHDNICDLQRAGRKTNRYFTFATSIPLLMLPLSSLPMLTHPAFLLIAINFYDIIAALQDNWTIYYYSAVSRVVAAAFFYNLGPEFHQLAGIEAATLVVLLGAISMGGRKT